MKTFEYTAYAKELEERKIDFFFCSASFEDRCKIIPQLSKNIKTYIFYNVNEFDQVVQNAVELKEKSGDISELIALDTNYPIANFIKVNEVIHALPQGSKSNLLIDVTTFTHETLLVLIRIIAQNKEKIGAIYIAYVGAKEYSTNTPNDEEKWLSKGIKDIRTVIGYSGFTDPTRKNHIVLLFGFEDERTRRIIEEYEFEHVSLGFAMVDDSIQTNHHRINSARHLKLLEEYPNANKFTFSLIDPMKTKEELLTYLQQAKFSGLNTVIAPLNNKISTVGAGLAAIENEDIQVAYARPNFYNIDGYSIANDTIYFGEIDFTKSKK